MRNCLCNGFRRGNEGPAIGNVDSTRELNARFGGTFAVTVPGRTETDVWSRLFKNFSYRPREPNLKHCPAPRVDDFAVTPFPQSSFLKVVC